MPCSDAALLKETKGQPETVKTSHQQEHDKTDACTPFCHCACCAGFSVNHTLAVITATTVYAEIPKTDFLPSQIIEIILPIWQPPQIA
jgi:hypothetical protein